MRKSMRMVSGAFLAATLVIGGSTQASEPANNTFTFNSTQLAGDYEMLAGTGSGLVAGSMIRDLSSHTDVDFMVVSCANRIFKHMDDIRLGGSPLGGALPGDFDIFVYDPETGNQIASGTLGGTNPENVNVSALNRSTVVVKVIHFSGLLGNYQLRVDCS